MIISILAILFTIFSFWWMNWRPGKLNIGTIRVFGAGVASEKNEGDVLVVTLPLILWNSGARPIVIDNLRLESKDFPDLNYEAIDSKITTSFLDPNDKITRDYYFLPKALKPNETIEANIVFQARDQKIFQWEPKIYNIDLKVSLMQKKGWEKLSSFSLNFKKADNIKIYNLNHHYEAYLYENPSGT